ncbi:hypothetical protein C8R45DRAFT_1208161 [Mycena sanguinolenta]|nr:hypothetical protein C8R45DRAFT_1208161 [Mycena sanguinolenta]
MRMSYRTPPPPPLLVGPLVQIYDDPSNPTRLIGVSCAADSDYNDPAEEHWQAHLARPVLPDGELLLYHQVWRALFRGSQPQPSTSSHPDPHARPALPVELVRLILRAAGFMVPDREQTHRARRRVFVQVTIRDTKPIASRVWFWTKPLRIVNIAAVQLVTVSRDQGWVNPVTDVCHSWFEWGIFSGDIPSEEGALTGNERAWSKAKGKQAVWRESHGNRVAVRSYEQHNGPRVGIEDEMWNVAHEGSVIAVRACAQQQAWENDAAYGEILVWKWFEPVVRVA